MRKIISLFCTLFLILVSFTQLYAGSSWVWTQQYGTDSGDYGCAIALDPNGNIYITGYTWGELDYNTNYGYCDIIIVKYDANGNRLWARQRGSSEWDIGFGIAADKNGNVYVTGRTEGGIDGNTHLGGLYDYFIIKYNTDGDTFSTKQLGTDLSDVGYAIAVDTNDNVYVTGATSGALDGNTNKGSSDIFITKYDTNEDWIWTKQPGTDLSDVGYGIAVDTAGNVYVTGETYGGLDGNTNKGSSDIFITKYDTNGNWIWTKQPGTSSDDRGYGIAVDTAGNAYVTGRTRGDLDDNMNRGDYDIFITKYDTNGNWIWTKQFGTPTSEHGLSIAVDKIGDIYVTGWTNGDLHGNIHKGGVYDIFITKYDTNGGHLWTKQPGTSGSEEGKGVVVDTGGNVYVTGRTNNNLDGCAGKGDNDYFITKYAQYFSISGVIADITNQNPHVTVGLTGDTILSITTSDTGYYLFRDLDADATYVITPLKKNWIFEPENQTFTKLSEDKPNIDFTAIRIFMDDLENIKVYPNPINVSTDITGLKFSGLTENCNIRIYSICGKMVFEKNVNEINYLYGIENNRGNKLASGVYIFIISNEDGEEEIGKFAVVR